MAALDSNILLWIQQYFSCNFLDVTMVWISRLGNHGFFFILVGIVLLFFPKNDWRKWGVILLVALAINAILCNVVLKPLVARIRPYDVLGLQLLIPKPTDFSFPSGHTSAAVTMAGVFCRKERRLGILASIFAVIMAFSRLYLSVHYPTDILGGIFVGLISSFLSVKFFEKRL